LLIAARRATLDRIDSPCQNGDNRTHVQREPLAAEEALSPTNAYELRFDRSAGWEGSSDCDRRRWSFFRRAIGEHERRTLTRSCSGTA
jgi:hypothetical protein